MKKREVVNFGIQDVWPIALVLVVTGIGVAYGLKVMSDVSVGFTANSYAANASNSAQQGINTLASNIPTLALVIVAAIVIGVLVRNLSMGGQE